jgi:hypothetical protein
VEAIKRAAESGSALPERWYPLDHHPTHAALWNSRARFKVVPAGRRSGKTELAKRKGVLLAMAHDRGTNGRYLFGAPTREQAKEIFWHDLKLLVPSWALAREPLESELRIPLVNGANVQVVGLDRPQRIEGSPVDWICLDEYGDMKPEAWDAHVSPAVDTRGREGSVWFIGKPVGRNHYYDLFVKAQTPRMRERGWEGFTWKSSDILDPQVVEDARLRMDPRTFDQHYNASFLDFTGRVYYGFSRETHAVEPLPYYPTWPLIIAFDFNVEPGVAVILQEQPYEGDRREVAQSITAVIGEVWIPVHSNTLAVSRRLAELWGEHVGPVRVYGDASGGQRSTSATDLQGGDWRIVRDILGKTFGDRLTINVGKANPSVRDRVNAVNTRLRTSDGVIRMLVDPDEAPHVAKDFDGVVYKPGTSDILKIPGGELTHVTDALGYYVHRRWPLDSSGGTAVVRVSRG